LNILGVRNSAFRIQFVGIVVNGVDVFLPAQRADVLADIVFLGPAGLVPALESALVFSVPPGQLAATTTAFASVLPGIPVTATVVAVPIANAVVAIPITAPVVPIPITNANVAVPVADVASQVLSVASQAAFVLAYLAPILANVAVANVAVANAVVPIAEVASQVLSVASQAAFVLAYLAPILADVTVANTIPIAEIAVQVFAIAGAAALILAQLALFLAKVAVAAGAAGVQTAGPFGNLVRAHGLEPVNTLCQLRSVDTLMRPSADDLAQTITKRRPARERSRSEISDGLAEVCPRT
jgi:hypothetical protein